jgi:hypothetical protein
MAGLRLPGNMPILSAYRLNSLRIPLIVRQNARLDTGLSPPSANEKSAAAPPDGRCDGACFATHTYWKMSEICFSRHILPYSQSFVKRE